jgi:hypothetical protein
MRWGVSAASIAVALFAVSPAFAGKERIPDPVPAPQAKPVLTPSPGKGGFVMAQERRRPGVPERDDLLDLPPVDPNAVPPPSPNLPRETIPIPDRWRLIENIGVNERWWDPYSQNTLKGDRPIFDDWFVNLSVISDTIYEPRSFPTPTSPSTSPRTGQFAQVGTQLFATTLIPSISFIKGNTAYKPPDYEIRLTPVINYNRAAANEERLLKIRAFKSKEREDHHIGLQEAFFDYHIRNVSDRYDFDSVRVGIQPFQSDFRGFLFQDQQLGVRFFGNRDNNFWQYNLAAIWRVEKDTNSGLNDITQDLRKDWVLQANVYKQDFPFIGFTSQATVMYNRNREDGKPYYNENGFQERPAPIGVQRPHGYDVVYFGYNGDGHYGRLNLTTSAYFAWGKDYGDPFLSQTEKVKSDIRAFMFAAEPSIDFSWIRVRGSFMYASGDDDPTDGKQNGFDAIFENPQFAGADTSYWIRQAVPLIGGGGLQLSGRNGLLNSMRTSKEQGQSNFNNPGLILAGGGIDVDVTPELRLTTNINHLSFVNTSVIENLRMQELSSNDIGWDVSVALTYRPGFIQNVVFRLSGAMLFGGRAFEELFQTKGNTLYSVLANLTLTY